MRFVTSIIFVLTFHTYQQRKNVWKTMVLSFTCRTYLCLWTSIWAVICKTTIVTRHQWLPCSIGRCLLPVLSICLVTSMDFLFISNLQFMNFPLYYCYYSDLIHYTLSLDYQILFVFYLVIQLTACEVQSLLEEDLEESPFVLACFLDMLMI